MEKVPQTQERALVFATPKEGVLVRHPDTGKPLAELPWRTRLKDPDAMKQIKITSVIAAFDGICRKFKLLNN